jgi:hypothetical protein
MNAPWFRILIGVPELAGGIGLLLALATLRRHATGAMATA